MTTLLKSLVYIFLVLAINEQTFCQLDFKDHIDVPGEMPPLEMAIGDFDNNGLRDIAYTTLSSGGLQVLLHFPGGHFEAINIPALHGTSSVYPLASGDIDGDGRDDLVIFDNARWHSSDRVVLMRYDGDAFISSRHSTGIFVSKDIELIDFNGDGKLDIVCASDVGPVEVLEGDGKGSFNIRLLPTDDVNYVTFGLSDLNGDGKLDLVGGTYDNELVTYLSNGTSYIQKRYQVTSQIADIVIEDISGDQIPDIIAASFASASLYNYTNDGHGQLIPSNIALPDKAWQGLDAADYDNDGRSDIIVGAFGLKGITLMKNLGASRFQDILSSGGDTDYVVDIKFDDLDVNGTQEIIAVSAHKRLDIYTLSGASYIRTEARILGILPTEGLIVDLDLDGNNDLIAGSLHAKLISVYYGNGSGTFAGRRDFSTDVEIGAIEVGDFNGDGYPDIAWSTHPSAQPSRISLIMSTAEGLLEDRSTKISSHAAYVLESVDVDKDGDLDLICNSVILNNNGAGLFTETSFSPGVSTYLVGSGDLNGDEYPDLVVGDRSTNLRIGLNNGAGNFGLFQTLETPAPIHSLELVNLNNEGMMGIVLVHQADSKVSVLTRVHTGDYVTQTISIDFRPGVTTTADFNEDGLADIAVGTAANAEEYYLNILLQNSNGEFQPGPHASIGNLAYSLANGDLDNDGKTDIAGFSPNGAGISILHNDVVLQPTKQTGEIHITALTSNSVSLLLGPGDGDGRIVLFKDAQVVDAEPADGLFYGSNAAFGVGAEIANDNFVVLRGEDLATTVTGLKEDTDYHLAVFEYNVNGRNTIINYFPMPLHYSFRTKKSQHIANLDDITLTDEQLAPMAVESSAGLPVVLEVIEGNVMVSENLISIQGPGPVVIRAVQEGNSEYDAASEAFLEFCVNPPVPVITVEIDHDPFKVTLHSSSVTNNQWMVNGSYIQDETGTSYEPEINGVFHLKVDYNGCFALSEPTDFLYTSIEANFLKNVRTYPNPVRSSLIIQSDHPVKSVTLVDPRGNVVYSKTTNLGLNHEVDVRHLPAAVYILKVETDYGTLSNKLLVSPP